MGEVAADDEMVEWFHGSMSPANDELVVAFPWFKPRRFVLRQPRRVGYIARFFDGISVGLDPCDIVRRAVSGRYQRGPNDAANLS